MDNLKDKIQLYLKQGEDIKQSIGQYLADQSIDIEERWSLFELISEKGILSKPVYSDGFIGILDENATLYDDFNIDRYCTGIFKNMYEDILENNIFEKTKITAWREMVLKSGYDGFIYDW